MGHHHDDETEHENSQGDQARHDCQCQCCCRGHHGHGHGHGHHGHGHGHGHGGHGHHGHHGHKKNGLHKLIKLVVLGFVVAAVVKELQQPAEERTWNGVVAGGVPYDFRAPTLERVKERVWDPEGENLISPHVFGVGWTVNVGRVVALVRQKLSE